MICLQYLHKALKKLAGDKDLASTQLISGRLEENTMPSSSSTVFMHGFA